MLWFWRTNEVIFLTKLDMPSWISNGDAFACMYAGVVTIRFFQSTQTPATSISSKWQPNEVASSIAPAYGKFSPRIPSVILALFGPSTLERTIGEMQLAPMILPAEWKSLSTSSTSCLTDISLPLKAQSHKFLAAPKPPGIKSASKSFADSSLMSLQSPLAIRADSCKMLRAGSSS